MGSINIDPEQGIALTLAEARAKNIRELKYDLSFDIPENAREPVQGRAVIQFTTKDSSRPLVLDFEPGADSVTSVLIAGKPASFRAVNGHVVIPSEALSIGGNSIEIAFRAGDASLNRNSDFLYTLFVPARAHLAFPCFDQPDLKARFTLGLTIPSGWQAVANGQETSRNSSGDGVAIRYAETPPISTYLFAFAAGKFQVESAERNGRVYRMFHRETDKAKVNRNRAAVFDLHASSIQWLEQYTSIPYPFGKFDFVLIPSFQFSGMEHPGAIFYNASSVLLDESATENQLLGRAGVIAHETAHMWFGDLVTMRWFNDVWMKEVFASFMASKIVNPLFPKVNHELRFFLANYPSAYAVDRTGGSHPIRQELENLREAGSLYGAIIYQKAPIVMRHLERILGADGLRDGLREHLKQFEFGNATWNDLVKLLDARTDIDLAEWSRVWVEEAGRPTIRTEPDDRGEIAFTQADSQSGRSLRWTQPMQVSMGTLHEIRSIPVEFRGERAAIAKGGHAIDFILPSGGGLAYGDFILDNSTRAFLLKNLPVLKDPLTRGAAWVTLWEELLGRRVRPSEFLDAALAALPAEDTEQNVELVVAYLNDAFWMFIPHQDREKLGPRLEQTLRHGLSHASSKTLKSAYFSAFRSTVTTPEGVAFLERIWRHQEKIPGLQLSEPDETTIALELALRSGPGADAILQEQRKRFTNPDRKARFEFVMPALSASEEARDRFFVSLSDVKNRRREPWVLEGLRFLNHPLRSPQSDKYVRPALELLLEIQRTGDIFFPRNWMNAVLGGRNTRASAEIVRAFLAEQRNYPVRLQRIILQSADNLFRASEIVIVTQTPLLGQGVGPAGGKP